MPLLSLQLSFFVVVFFFFSLLFVYFWQKLQQAVRGRELLLQARQGAGAERSNAGYSRAHCEWPFVLSILTFEALVAVLSVGLPLLCFALSL